ncbi:hypothetical protein BCR35DRAFT_334742 [Leucosporidium creatinivorum]|uniref:F-box domain-containing protein n=1 Tax=Leucosporidium creatinivorum TaxID=106004 RepID=A0A1Y2DWZ2_9BASI|nr:hypothetical protein BCR35DRAFT_334742 [Leucosporidium creatinivorum]
MGSQDTTLKQESSEMVQMTPSSLEALPSAFSSLSLDIPKPKTFNDLPDELLDDIACYFAGKDLRNLALVEKRLYPPSRRFALWTSFSFSEILAFGDVLLERPEVGLLVRELALSGAPWWSDASALEESPLVGRAMGVVIQACPNVRELYLHSIRPNEGEEEEVLAAVARLKRLQKLSLPFQGTSLKGIKLLFPILHRGAGTAAPNFPPSALKAARIGLVGSSIKLAEQVLESLVVGCRRLDLCLWNDPRPSFADFAPFLPSYIADAEYFALRASTEETPSDWKRLKLPSRAGWMYYSSTRYPERRPERRVIATTLLVGSWLDIKRGLAEDAEFWQAWQFDHEPTTILWARRGSKWSAGDSAEVQFLRRRWE